MRRLLLIFLLVFMPLQSVWAAAANYCSHEAAPGSAHFGHHVHEHHGAGEGADGAEGEKAGAGSAKASPDMDCHAHGTANALHQDASVPPLWVQAMQLVSFVRFTLPTPSPQRPERPNWHPLA